MRAPLKDPEGVIMIAAATIRKPPRQFHFERVVDRRGTLKKVKTLCLHFMRIGYVVEQNPLLPEHQYVEKVVGAGLLAGCELPDRGHRKQLGAFIGKSPDDLSGQRICIRTPPLPGRYRCLQSPDPGSYVCPIWA